MRGCQRWQHPGRFPQWRFRGPVHSIDSWQLQVCTGVSFLVIRCTLHLDSLKARPPEDDQETRFLRTACSSDESSWVTIVLEKLVSSAKAATWLDCTTSGSSEFAYKRNSIGPKIEPDFTGSASDDAPSDLFQQFLVVASLGPLLELGQKIWIYYNFFNKTITNWKLKFRDRL